MYFHFHPNQKSNKKESKKFKKVVEKKYTTHCIFIFIWQFSSFFEEKKSGSFLDKNSRQYSGSYSKTKRKKREREKEEEEEEEEGEGKRD